ncbi:MAG: succinate dehydrogenase, hydrophobic membrane anchor protein [Erythrobacter sp.]|jgi:succinate dehydrogenase / fumarate reductase membrane anchor subunit|nr:succinate dehydrogenase, hydrophobic membrane anchor protein [Erythrobacter sp.]
MGNGTSIGRVRGLGSSHHGGQHWLKHRFTAIANVVLMTWFVISIVLLGDYSHASVADWISQPIPAVAMILLAANVFMHAQMGLTVLIEDYIHESGSKFALLTLLNLAAVGGGAFAIFCVARLAFGA